MVFSCSGVQALSVRAQVQNQKNHNANPRTLGVLYSLLMVEGQGAQPRASGSRKQVWVCSADAGSATPGRPQEKSVNTLHISKEIWYLGEMGWHMSLGDRDVYRMPISRRICTWPIQCQRGAQLTTVALQDCFMVPSVIPVLCSRRRLALSHHLNHLLVFLCIMRRTGHDGCY